MKEGCVSGAKKNLGIARNLGGYSRLCSLGQTVVCLKFKKNILICTISQKNQLKNYNCQGRKKDMVGAYFQTVGKIFTDDGKQWRTNLRVTEKNS